MPTTEKSLALPGRVYCPNCERDRVVITIVVDFTGYEVRSAWCADCDRRWKLAAE